jgi:hypothetical protein
MRLLLTVLVVAAATSLLASAGATPVRSGACAPGYIPCLPRTADLNCGQIADTKKPIRVTGSDPYALDRDRDGLGCERSGDSGDTWGLILRSPPRKEATSAKVGTSLRVVGWAPSAVWAGERYELCATRGARSRCVKAKGKLTGKVQVLGTWKVARGERIKNVFKLSLRVRGRVRTSDTVPFR